MHKLRKTNINTISLIDELKAESIKRNAPIWRDLAKRLEKSSQNWAEVNISHINKYANKNDTILIPGKLLGAGYINKPVTIAAVQSSQNAAEKINNAGGKVISIPELMKKNPKGTGIRIFNK